jgi:ABC-type antimicrobial peptide transport system permease subunit
MQGRKGTVFSGSIYISQTLGTLIVDEEFLESKFGEVKYCAKRADFHPQGLIITDYVADALLLRSGYINKDYAYLVQYGYSYSSNNGQNRFLINGIIETGYRETYKDLIEKLTNKKGSIPLNELYMDPDFQVFANDVYDRLGYSYTINPNFLEDYIEAEASNSPNFFKMVFNNLLSLSNSSVNIKRISDNGTKSWGDNNTWKYTETAPIIPDGAKYIRLSYHPYYMGCLTKEMFGEKQTYPILAFNNGEPISEEVMACHENAILATNGAISSTPMNGYFVSDYIEIPENGTITDFLTMMSRNYAFYSFYDAEKNLIVSEIANADVVKTKNTILLPASTYEKLFADNIEKLGDNWVEKVKPQKMKLSHYSLYDVEKKNPLFEKTVTVGVHSGSNILMSDDLFSLFYKDSVFEHALYLDGVDGIGKALDTSERIRYSPQSHTVEGVHTMTKAVDVFIPIFELVAIFLCVGVVFIMVNFSSRMIHEKMHEIGILKALGVKNHSIVSIFGMQVLLIAVLTCGLATAGYYVFIGTANDVLINSLKELAPSHIVLDLNFLDFHASISIFNCILVFALSVISLIFPMIKIKMIKPVKIIKAKD